jgi:hypothetical protein
LIDAVRFGLGRMVQCSCGVELSGFDDDAEMTTEFTRHRQTEIRAGRAEVMVRTRISSGSQVRFRLEKPGAGSRPPQPGASDPGVTISERLGGYDRPAPVILDVHRIGGIGGRRV